MFSISRVVNTLHSTRGFDGVLVYKYILCQRHPFVSIRLHTHGVGVGVLMGGRDGNTHVPLRREVKGSKGQQQDLDP